MTRWNPLRPHPRNGRERPFVFLTVNGKSMDVPAGLTVDGLLSHLSIKRQYTAVAVNREITPKDEYDTLTLKDGDKVEIVRPMGGG